MGDFVLIDGDQAVFLPAFGAATVVVQPGRLTGSGPMKVTGKAACVDGDEKSVSVPGCMYIAPPYVSPGTAHEWQSWRRSLNEFAPLLFQE